MKSNPTEPAAMTDDGEPETPMPEQAAEEETLDSLRAQRDEFESLWKRARADYQNQKRRALADQEAWLRQTLQPLLEGMLLVLDNLDLALSSPTTTDESRNLAMGVKLTRDQLVRALEQNEVTQIPTEGAFDPALHQAMDTVADSEAEPGTIVETLRHGYLWRGIPLRFAQVRVAAGEPSGEE